MGDNLNMIMIKGEGGLLNDDFKLDSIEGKKSRTFENSVLFIQKIDESYVLFNHFKHFYTEV